MATCTPMCLVIVILLLVLVTDAQVPKANTFRFVNEGEFGPYITEYDASYRAMPLSGSPFQLMWYNTTPGRFYVGLRMGVTRSESLFRWVWDANRGRPVGEKATLTFGTDGNLVLAESNGKLVWSTNTANKGVVGVKILPVGNIVLYDKKGRFVWQSFNHPTDTLMVGQSLYVGGPTKIVSRRSGTDNSDGIYSFVMEPKGLNLYLTPPTASKSKPLLYSSDRYSVSGKPPLTNATFDINPPGSEKADAYELELATNAGATFTVTRPKYNATLSILRLQVDGNLVVYTYYDPVDHQAWERTYAYFSDDIGELPGCSLPSKCGALGVCEANMCVACPTADKGLVGWSKSCSPPPKACKRGPSSYYKVVGVEQFIPRLNKAVGGKVKVEDCKRKCGGDCGCRGVFYWEESSTCWLAPVLGSLTRVSNSSHVLYIKSDNGKW